MHLAPIIFVYYSERLPSKRTVVEIVYIEQTDWIDCSRKLSIVLNVSLLTLRHA